jgi:hypothetical protein
MPYEDGPQLPLTSLKKALLAAGVAMFAAQVVAAIVAAPRTTGAGHADAGVLAAMWCVSVVWSAVAVLLLVRQADLPDVATASFIVVIATFAAFALTAALAARGTDAEVNVVDAMFFGVTTGALTALIVWAIALGVARLLRLPTSAGLGE